MFPPQNIKTKLNSSFIINIPTPKSKFAKNIKFDFNRAIVFYKRATR